MRTFVLLILAASLLGCGPTEADRQRSANEAAVKAEKHAAVLKDKLRSAYDLAYQEGKKISVDVGEKASDGVLRAKVIAAFKLIQPLDSSKIEVQVKKGVIFLDGSVKTEQERMIAEGLAYGVTGDGKRVRSTLSVPKTTR